MECTTSWRRLTMCCLMALGGAVPATSFAAAVVNDASLYNVDWANESLSNWTVSTATGAAAPTIQDGYLVLNNTNATAGTTGVAFKTLTGLNSVQSDKTLIVTTRFAIDQFPSAANPINTPTAGKFQFRLQVPPINTSQSQTSYVSVVFNPTSIYTVNNVSGTTSNVTTAAGTFYTWQFEVTLPNPPSYPTAAHPEWTTNLGSVTIYRRLNDADAWTLVGQNVPIGVGNSATVSGNVGGLAYHTNLTTQGIVRQDYFQAGYAVPEPAAGFTTLMIGGLAMLRRQRRA